MRGGDAFLNNATLANARAPADPGVIGLHHPFQVGVAQDPRGHIAGHACNFGTNASWHFLSGRSSEASGRSCGRWKRDSTQEEARSQRVVSSHLKCSIKGDVKRNVSPPTAAQGNIRAGIQPPSLTRRFWFLVLFWLSVPRARLVARSGEATYFSPSQELHLPCRYNAIRFRN